MFGRKVGKEQLMRMAEVSKTSGIDYLLASAASPGAERAAFLVLAHSQSIAAAAFSALAVTEDKSLRDELAPNHLLAESLRMEVRKLAEKGMSSQPTEPFPRDEALRKLVRRCLEEGIESDALELGLEAAWADPMLNV